MPFYKGEIVEILDTDANRIRLGIVAETPMSLEDKWERSKIIRHPIHVLDLFRVIVGEDESEFFKTDLIFKPSFPVSDRIRNCLNEWYETDLQGGSTDLAALLKLL